jgi:hypothetical protein
MRNPWNKIETPKFELNVRLMDKGHPLDLYWGLDVTGGYLFIVTAPVLSDNKLLPKLEGLDTFITERDGRKFLVLQLKDKENWEIFLALCNDLASSTKDLQNEKSAGPVILRRLERWQEFLKNKKLKILSDAALKGLLGEILFLKKIATSHGWKVAIESWKGPEGAPQDFAIYDMAVEIKCQSGSSRPKVKISSIDQLEPQLPKAYLAVYTIANSDEKTAFSINSLTQTIRQSIHGETHAVRERFEDLLVQADYIFNEKYDDLKFKEIEFNSYAINEGFPRLIASQIPDGINDITYHIDLDSCSKFLEPIVFNQ